MPPPNRPIDGTVPAPAPADAFVGAPPQSAAGAAAGDLAGYAREFTLFTPGLLYTHGGLDKDLVQEYVNEAGAEVPVVRFLCPRPVFAGMTEEWNHTLLATPREYWAGLRRHLATAEILDRARGVYYRTFPFSLVVADPGVAPRDPMPTTEVIVFGLDGNLRRVAIRPARVIGRDLPTTQSDRPDPATAARAAVLLAGGTPAPEVDAGTAAAFETLAEGPPSDTSPTEPARADRPPPG